MTISTLDIHLDNDQKQRRYPIYIGTDLLKKPEYLKQHIQGNKVMIVSNTQVAPLYLDTILQTLSDFTCDTLILPEGESYKTWGNLTSIFDALIERGHDRSTTLIALGGGVIGDMTGFAASVYLRGVHFIQMPTSLLAQVDASVGGKTAVNHALGKNLLGAFYQPQCVVIDPKTLLTLADAELYSGLAEAIKHALIADPDFFEWLEKYMPQLLAKDMTALQYLIERCCQIKATIVEQDEREQNVRAWLNLGHTFGHAIEHLTDYEWKHGEAIAAGLVLAATLSEKQGHLNSAQVARIIQLLQAAHLPTRPPAFPAQHYWDAMMRDKKNRENTPTFILLKDIGVPLITSDVPKRDVLQVFN